MFAGKSVNVPSLAQFRFGKLRRSDLGGCNPELPWVFLPVWIPVRKHWLRLYRFHKNNSEVTNLKHRFYNGEVDFEELQIVPVPHKEEKLNKDRRRRQYYK